MSFTDYPQQLIPISSIIINRDERQRRLVETADLEKSISRVGLIHPVVVRQECCQNYYGDDKCCGTYGNILVAGERRIQACSNLGWTDIPVRFFHNLSSIEASIIELEENIKRQDLEWQEKVNAVARIHALYLSLDPGWTMTETAEAVSMSLGNVSLFLSVSDKIEAGDQRIIDAGTVREAYNVLKRRDAREQANSLEELLALPLPEEAAEMAAAGIEIKLPVRQPSAPSLSDTVLHQSFLEWAPSYSGPRFNFIHCDFPYGISPFVGEQGRGANPDHYADDETVYFNLIDCFCETINRLSSVSCHVMFWFSMKLHQATLLKFQRQAPQILWQPHPLIWLKSDNAGISPDPSRLPRHIYETALLGSIGSRQIVRVVADAYSCPSDHRLHPSCKPESMLRHFFTMLVDEHTSMLDPTCGSGSSLRAAESLSASSTLGLEANLEYAETARLALRNFRNLRQVGT